MSRNRFDEVESQVANIARKHWTRVNGRFVRTASEELRKGRVVLFGNHRGNIFIDIGEPFPFGYHLVRNLNDIGLFMGKDTVVELTLTEVEKLCQQ